MVYEDNMFRRMNPAEIIRRIAASDPSLAMISLMDADTLERIGWSNNPIIDILYSLTSAGVWAANRNTDGSEIVDSSLRDYTNYAELESRVMLPLQWGSARPTDGTDANYRIHKYNVATIVSNAGGNIAADVDISPAAVPGYFYTARIIALICTDAALTPTLVLQDSAAAACSCGNLSTAASVANVPITTLKDIPITTSTDNVKLVIDTTSSGLGNTKTWRVIYEYWLET